MLVFCHNSPTEEQQELAETLKRLDFEAALDKRGSSSQKRSRGWSLRLRWTREEAGDD